MAEKQQHDPSVIAIVRASWSDFGKDDCGTRAAALAFATIFALPPLLILLVVIVGRIWSPAEVQTALETQFSGTIGPDGARQVHQMLVHGMASPGRGLVATISSVIGLLLGATGAFLALQAALNQAWNVMPDPKAGGIRSFITKRLLSLGMVLGLGFLLAASLAVTAGISALGGTVLSGMSAVVKYAVDIVLSLIVLSSLFAALFKVLPDAEIDWRDVWVGGAATALMFVAGKYAIGIYLGHSKPGDAFGAASALAVLLVWAYYAGMIVLFGAEFTQEWAMRRGSGLVPSRGAVRVVQEELIDGARAADSKRPAAAQELTTTGRGGVVDWVVGLPVLYLLFRKRNDAAR